jgi:hypothetical protein
MKKKKVNGKGKIRLWMIIIPDHGCQVFFEFRYYLNSLSLPDDWDVCPVWGWIQGLQEG